MGFIQRAAALLLRLCLLPAIWHAPLPSLHVHGEAVGHAHQHQGAAETPGGSRESTWEIGFVLPCELNGCGQSPPLEGDSDPNHSRHVAALGFSVPAKTDTQVVDRGLSACPRGSAPPQTMSPAASDETARLLALAANRRGARLVSGAENPPTLPLRAALQVYLV